MKWQARSKKTAAIVYNAAVDGPQAKNSEALRVMQRAMRLSLAIGLLMLTGKVSAYLMTGSAAILSDAAESVIHVVAVGFAAFSLRLSVKPADSRFRYGYERITFFSAGFEGALIALAAVYILVMAVTKWITGIELANLGGGTLLILGAAMLNGWLGWHLVRTGRRTKSMILEADGKHVLADSVTSFGVVVGLCLVYITGWKPFDPLCAIAVALNILWSGGRLIWRSFSGLMDYADPSLGSSLGEGLHSLCSELGVQYHGVRFRSTGHRTMVEVHLLFPYEVSLGEAHRIATVIEERLPQQFEFPVEVVTHLEALEDHGQIHREKHFTEV
jgi:cation diffusion facilitator family transporter